MDEVEGGCLIAEHGGQRDQLLVDGVLHEGDATHEIHVEMVLTIKLLQLPVILFVETL